MSERLNELLAKAVAWEKKACIGDGGERPSFDISRTNGRWEVWASSFYDGGGQCFGKDLEQCIETVLDEIYNHPEKERERDRQAAVRALATYKQVSHQEAEEMLSALSKKGEH